MQYLTMCNSFLFYNYYCSNQSSPAQSCLLERFVVLTVLKSPHFVSICELDIQISRSMPFFERNKICNDVIGSREKILRPGLYNYAC